MAELSELVRKAYDIYGSTLGIPSVTVPMADYTNQFKRISDFHFFLKGEPLPPLQWEQRRKLINESKIHHCSPSKKGFYDYIDGKTYETLEVWYEEIKKAIYGESAPPFKEAILYGRRERNGLAYEMTYEDLVAKLTQLTSVNRFEKKSDTWDTLFQNFPTHISRRGLRLYYKHPELETMFVTRVMNNRLNYGWNPEKPRYTVPVMNQGNAQPIYSYTKSVSELHPFISLEDIYIETSKKYEGYLLDQRVLIPLSELIKENA